MIKTILDVVYAILCLGTIWSCIQYFRAPKEDRPQQVRLLAYWCVAMVVVKLARML